MRKTLSIVVALIMIFSLGLQSAFAVEIVSVDYTLGGVAAAGTDASTIAAYTDTTSENWKWYGDTWSSTSAIAKIRNWNKDSDDRIHIYATAKDEWFALEIKAPEAGIYAADFDYFGYNNANAGACDVYVIKKPASADFDANAVNETLQNSTAIGNLNFKDTSLAANGTVNKNKELKNIVFEADTEYLLVFKTTKDGELLVKNLHIEQLGSLSEFAAAISNSAIAIGEQETISVEAKDSNGVALPTNNLDSLTFTTDNNNVVTVSGTGVVTGVSSGTAKITITAVLGNVTKTAEIDVTVYNVEKYLFSGVKNTWTVKQGTSSYKTVEGIPYDQTTTENWAWYSKNMTSDNFKVFALSVDSRLQVAGMAEGDWFALKIKAPRTGKYTVALESCLYGGSAGKSDIYIIPICDTSEISDALTTKALAGNVNFSDSSIASGTTTTTIKTLKDFTFYENKEYLVVFKVTAAGTIRPNQLILSELLGAEIEEEQEQASSNVSFAETTNIDGFDSITVQTVKRGNVVTLTAHGKEIEGYRFVGWKRGADTSDENAWVNISGDEYSVWTNTYLTAIYEKVADDAEKVVEFWNQNGAYLGKSSEENFKTDVAKIPTLTGFGSFIGWFTDGNKQLTAETELTAGTTNAVAQYEDGVVSGVKYNGNVVEEANVYNKAVSFTKSIDGFTCWKRDGEIVSYDNTYTYNVWDATNITEGTDEIADRVPVGVLEYSENHDAYMLEYDDGDYEIVEGGIIFGGETIDSCAKKYSSQRKVSHNQFTVPAEGRLAAKGYIIYTTGGGASYVVKYFEVAE